MQKLQIVVNVKLKQIGNTNEIATAKERSHAHGLIAPGNSDELMNNEKSGSTYSPKTENQ